MDIDEIRTLIEVGEQYDEEILEMPAIALRKRIREDVGLNREGRDPFQTFDIPELISIYGEIADDEDEALESGRSTREEILGTLLGKVSINDLPGRTLRRTDLIEILVYIENGDSLADEAAEAWYV